MVPAQLLAEHNAKDYTFHLLHPFPDDASGVAAMRQVERLEIASFIGGFDQVDCSAMAEEESRNESLNDVGSSSKEERDGEWLQLSIGSSTRGYSRWGRRNQSENDGVDDPSAPRIAAEREVVTDLARGTSHRVSMAGACTVNLSPRPVVMSIAGVSGASILLQNPGSSSLVYPPFPLHYVPCLPSLRPLNPPPLSSSSSSLFRPGNYTPSSLQNDGGRLQANIPSSDFAIIEPPRKRLSCIWFVLQASENQAKEPFLPQISKSYLRIKDGRMTVQLVLKYLVQKLSLVSESEMEITCRGQQLLPTLTLQQVRDSIWGQREALTNLQPISSTAGHIMVLIYSRRA